MAAAHVQNNHAASGSAASVIVHLTSNATKGNTMFSAFCLPVGASVVSVNDTINGRWIQCANASSSEGVAELWMSRGVQGGNASVTAIFSASGVGTNVSEFSGLFWVDPLDAWSQNFGVGSTVTPQQVQPRAVGDLIFVIGNSGASVSGASGGYTSLTVDGTGNAAAYIVTSGSVATATHWNTTGTQTWCALEAAFVVGSSAANPLLQFPETLVEISTTANYQAPLTGTGIWTNITSDVRNMSLGPIGRQHELDRVQSAPSQITVNNRSGVYNTWNASSFLYNNGFGLKPMNPVKVTAAWNGSTYPQYYGYLQSVTPVINDVLDVDATLACIDIFQMMSLKYLSNDNYAQLIEADGGPNLVAYYRLGDPAGQYSVANAASVGAPGSLINGPQGEPAFGMSGAFLYDADTALDLTNGTNLANDGFVTDNNATSPPTIQNPLAGASTWTIEFWMKWTGGDTSLPSPTTSVPNGVLMHMTTNTFAAVELQVGYVVNVVSGGTSVTSGDYIWFVVTGGTSTLGNRFSSVNPFDGNWHHVVISTVSTSFTFLYVDAQLAAQSGGAGAFTNPTAIHMGAPPFGNGLDPSGGSGPVIDAVGFSGILDEVAFYTTGLSASVVASHYAQGNWFQTIESGAINGNATVGRLNKVMAVCGLPSSVLVVPYPFLTELYAETNAVTTTSALNYLQTQTETEPGLIFQGPNGMIYAYSREYQYVNPTSITSQGVFGDSLSAAYHYDGTQLQIVQDDLDIFNDVQVQSGRSSVPTTLTTAGVLQEWGPTQSSVAALSASVYGPRTMQGLTSLQQQMDSDALALAQNYIAWYTNPLARVQQIVLHSSANSGNNLPQMLGRGLMDRVTIQYNGQSPGPQFAQDSLVESIAHNIVLDQGPLWTTSWQMSPYEIIMSPFYLDSSTLDGPAVLTL